MGVSVIDRMLRHAFFFCWAVVILISIDHLFPFCRAISELSTFAAGLLGWGTAAVSLLFCGRSHLKMIFVVALFAFLAGLYLGSYLEPPADPLEHLRRVHEEVFDRKVNQISRSNRGLWHYSMSGVILQPSRRPVNARLMLLKIRLVHGMFWALSAATLLILGFKAGLPGRWSLLSVVICFLFFGTNRFSYFKYYSLAPSCTSTVIYWFWAACFFFKRCGSEGVKGTIVACLLIPVIWVNHRQEAVFLIFLVFLWWGVDFFTHVKVEKTVGRRCKWVAPWDFSSGKTTGVVVLLFVLFILPQWEGFRGWLAQYFIRGLHLHYYHKTWITWHGFYLGGRLDSATRVLDTLGTTGILIGLLAVPYFLVGRTEGRCLDKIRIYLLAILPFIVYLVPLFHYLWSSNVLYAEYYRLCYASMFWLFFADVFRSFGDMYIVSETVPKGKG